MQGGDLGDRPESPEERMQRRRARRWKRRARIAGPFIGVPILLATLALSVDLIEYAPAPKAKRLTDRPIPESVLQKQGQRPVRLDPSVSTASVIPPSNAVVGTSVDDIAFSLGSEPIDTTERRDYREFSPPPAPYATRGLR